MWMAVFVWCLFSSAVIYSTAAVLAFAALRKHSLGRFLNTNTGSKTKTVLGGC